MANNGKPRKELKKEFQKVFPCDFPLNDWDRRCIQQIVDVTIGRTHSHEQFMHACSLAKEAGLYVYESRSRYISLVPGRLDPSG